MFAIENAKLIMDKKYFFRYFQSSFMDLAACVNAGSIRIRNLSMLREMLIDDSRKTLKVRISSNVYCLGYSIMI